MNIFYTPEAQADLSLIRYALDMRWENEKLTTKVLRNITDAARSLGTFPNMGIKLSEITGIPTEYKRFFCEHNYIFYRVGTDGVYIVRILNEKEDFIRALCGRVVSEDEGETE